MGTLAVLVVCVALLVAPPVSSTYSHFSDTASNADDTVQAATGPRATDAPAIIGTRRVGETLTAHPGSWTNGTTFAYRWERCVEKTPAECEPIAGAADPTYGLANSDADKVIRLVVKAADSSGFTTSADAFAGPVRRSYYQVVGDELAAGTLQSWWRMNDDTRADAGPAGVPLSGSASGWSASGCCGFGNPRGSWYFDGSGYAVAGDNYDFTADAPFSVELSVYTQTTGISRRLVDKTSSGQGGDRDGWDLSLDASNRVAFERWTDGTPQGAASAAEVPVETWTHVVVTYAGGIVRVYVNGELTGSGGTTLGLPDTDVPLTFAAAAYDHGIGVYTGYLDEVQIYDQALPQSRVSAHYEAWVIP